MSDFNDRISAAADADERVWIAREAAGLESPSWTSLGLGFFAGTVLGQAFVDLARMLLRPPRRP